MSAIPNKYSKDEPRWLYDIGRQYDAFADWMIANRITFCDLPINAKLETGESVVIDAYFEVDVPDMIFKLTYNNKVQIYYKDYKIAEYSER